MPQTAAEKAVASGLSIICSTCKKWAEGQEQGLSYCTAQTGCGGPMVGDTFHEYDGPITDFLRFCFVCGAPPFKALKVKNHTRFLGACERHLPLVTRMKEAPVPQRHLPIFGEAPYEAPKIILPSGNTTDIPVKRTLADALEQMDAGTFIPDGTETVGK